MIKGRHMEVMKMSLAKSRGARREVGHESSSRFGSLGLKTVQKAGFLVWASKPRSGELSEAKWPRNVLRHVAKEFGWFGLQNHQVEGFPGFGSKPGAKAGGASSGAKGVWMAQGHCMELRQGAPITRGRRM